MINLAEYLTQTQIEDCSSDFTYDLDYLIQHVSFERRPIEDDEGAFVCELCGILTGGLKLVSNEAGVKRWICLRCEVDLQSPYYNYTKKQFKNAIND